LVFESSNYSYKEEQKGKGFKGVNSINLVANGKEYSPVAYGAHVGRSKNSILMGETIAFDSMYFDNPKKIKIQVCGYRLLNGNHGRMDLDLSKPFPQHFEYLGSPITVEKVELGDQTARILVTDHMENREYESLNLKVVTHNSFYIKSYFNSDGFMTDKKGNRITDEEMDGFRGENGRVNSNEHEIKYFVTSYDLSFERFNIDNIPKETQKLIEQGKYELIPTGIEINGYNETKFTKGEITVRLKGK